MKKLYLLIGQVLLGSVVLFGVLGWVIGVAQVVKGPKEIDLVIPVTQESYTHAKELCGKWVGVKMSPHISVGVATVKGDPVTVTCRVVLDAEGGGDGE